MRKINDIKIGRYQAQNAFHSLFFLAGMVLVLSFIGWSFAGGTGVKWVLAIVAISLFLTPHVAPHWVLKLHAARPLSQRNAPRLYAAFQKLVRQAGVNYMPALFYIPSHKLNAFATGSRGKTAVAVSHGLLESLTMRELTAVLAHEVSHIKNNDLWIMNLSNTMGQVTSFLSTAGQMLLLVNLPLLLLTGHAIPWVGILVLIFAPSLTLFLQLALSRTREFNADLGAAALTSDPHGLASALSKMERIQGRMLNRMFPTFYRGQAPALLRTHPPTRERIKRLLSLGQKRMEHQYPYRMLFNSR